VHGLDSRSREALLNPARYGARTWCDARCYRFSVFTQPQCAAIVAFLRFIQASPDCLPGDAPQFRRLSTTTGCAGRPNTSLPRPRRQSLRFFLLAAGSI
jgi:hypothetical protein